MNISRVEKVPPEVKTDHPNPVAKALETARIQRIDNVREWARSRPFAKMKGRFWSAFRKRLEEVPAYFADMYVEELRLERAQWAVDGGTATRADLKLLAAEEAGFTDA